MLIVFAGRPGTGKTTLSRQVAKHLRAALLRIDAIETAIVRSGVAAAPVGPVGYVVAHEIAAACLAVGTPVVVDAVNPVPEARQAWPQLAKSAGVSLQVVEVCVADEAEHRRRIEQRQADLRGQVVPTWEQVPAQEYESWDENRDGRRIVVDAASPTALEEVLSSLGLEQAHTESR